MANPISVLVADDHALFRESLRKLLESDADFRVVGEAGDGVAAVRLAAERHPDVVLLDLCMPGSPVRDVLSGLAAITPPVRTLIVTAGVSETELVETLQFGARGVVLKHSTTDMLFRAIRAIMAGEYWLRREYVGDLIEQMRERTSPAVMAADRPRFGLTPRELEIVATVVAGYKNDDIAQKLSISTKTVKHHLTNIFAKVGVSRRLELALFAVEHGLAPGASD
jgi:two-component system nitrate/nitrite response regulator NarL